VSATLIARSKSRRSRFFSAQVEAYLAGHLWLRNAQHANAMAKALAVGLTSIPGAEIQGVPQANILFCRLSSFLIQRLLAEGFQFYHDRWEPGVVRFVTSFATTRDDVDDLLAVAQSLAG
jgi:threonine aldolase